MWGGIGKGRYRSFLSDEDFLLGSDEWGDGMDCLLSDFFFHP